TRAANDDQALAQLAELVARRSDAPRFVFVHLKAGHEPYDGAGSTPRERSEAAVRAALARLASIVAGLPDTWSVSVVGDHGEAFDEHGATGHATTLYDEVLRAPLWVRAPGVAPGVHTDELGCAEVELLALHGAGLSPVIPTAPAVQFATLDVPRGLWGT